MALDVTNLRISDLIQATNPADRQRATELVNHWYAQKIGADPSSIKTLIIDNNEVFPVFVKDTLETLIDRYAKMYRLEAKAMTELIAEGKKDSPDGKGHVMQSLMSIPPILKAAICFMYGTEWFTKKENIRKLAHLMPKFATCEVSKI